MSWELKWEGRATDFIPDLLKLAGSPGPVAVLAKDALWEVVQSVGERNPSAWVNVKAMGMENKEDPGSGQMTVMVEVKRDYEETEIDIQKQLREQQPVDLL